MRVDLVPYVIERAVRQLLWTQAMPELLIETHGPECLDLDRFAHRRVDSPLPGKAALRHFDCTRPGLFGQYLDEARRGLRLLNARSGDAGGNGCGHASSQMPRPVVVVRLSLKLPNKAPCSPLRPGRLARRRRSAAVKSGVVPTTGFSVSA